MCDSHLKIAKKALIAYGILALESKKNHKKSD
ncbi:hypothetical protein T36_2156 [Helicobacter cinaedi]|nr:hypothetical protein T36_2156 [Helicobacter cinaedi]